MDAKLVMFRPSGQRKDFPVINPVTVIGRGENCDLRVPLLSVSRRHCEVRVQGQAIKVRDLASSNGTYVNNSRLTAEADLRAGDRLAVGPIVFTLQLDGQPEEIRPVKTKGQQKLAEAEVDAEIVAQPGASALDDVEEEVDPIAALEALASQTPKKDRKGR
jgi:pSer/pThr/pTyr-binding forkhead associated (FHA) protein